MTLERTFDYDGNWGHSKWIEAVSIQEHCAIEKAC